MIDYKIFILNFIIKKFNKYPWDEYIFELLILDTLITEPTLRRLGERLCWIEDDLKTNFLIVKARGLLGL